MMLLLRLGVWLFALLIFVDASSFKMDYLPAAHVRVDPILSENCTSDHVHTFYGPQNGIDPRRRKRKSIDEGIGTLWDDLVSSSIENNTGNVEENKSLYWHPTIYKKYLHKKNHTTASFVRADIHSTSVYYVWETGTDGSNSNTNSNNNNTTTTPVVAFPTGFQMIGGFDTVASQATAECIHEKPCNDNDNDNDNDNNNDSTTYDRHNKKAGEEKALSTNYEDHRNDDSDNNNNNNHKTINGIKEEKEKNNVCKTEVNDNDDAVFVAVACCCDQWWECQRQ